MNEPLLSALVSTYASERYLQGCLESLLAQTARDRIEIVVVDAGSPERESELVTAFRRRHPELAIQLVRTPVRESTSAAFDRATALARGRYVTTANADDRHHPEFAARMIAVLEQRADVGIAYADSAISNRDNETWTDTRAQRRFRWPAYTPAVALSCCLFGSQPVWRRCVHREIGGWDQDLRFANDHDLFLRVARHSGAIKVDEVLGLFLQRPDSQAGSGHRDVALAEACTVFRRHRRQWSLAEIVPGAFDSGPLAEAAAWFEFGNLCALGPYTDAQAALDAYRAAMLVPLPSQQAAAVRAAYANNSGCVLAAAGAIEPARRAFALAPAGDERSHNEARLAASVGGTVTLRELRFVELLHPIVTASRRARAVVVAADGSVHDRKEQLQVPWDVYEGPNGVPWQRVAAGATALV